MTSGHDVLTKASKALNTLWGTISFVAGPIYDNLTDKLRGGELVHEWLHQFLVRSNHDTNYTVHCQSSAKIDVSYQWLEEGLCFSSSGNQSSGKKAQEYFKESHKAAIEAFGDKSLSLQDQITASLLRITTAIHESGNDLIAMADMCVLALKQLHRIEGIKQMFAVFLKGGWKSDFFELERLDSIMLILCINHAIFCLCCQNKVNYGHLTNWPKIDLHDCTFHPIKNLKKIWKKITRKYEFLQLVNQNEFFWNIFASQRHFVINSRGEFIVPIYTDKMTKNMMVIAEGQEIMEVMFPNAKATLESERCSLVVDRNDNIHVVEWRKVRDENGSESEDLVWHIFDSNYKIVSTSVLRFIDARKYKHVDIAVKCGHRIESRSLIMIAHRDNQVYVCDDKGNMKVKFRQDEHWQLMNMSISDNNEVATVHDNGHVVRIVDSNDWTLKRTHTFPEGHKAKQVAFRSDTSKLKVLTCVEENDCWFRYSLSETGECEPSVPLHQLENAEQHWWINNMQTFPTTAVPVAVGKNIAFI